MKDQFLLDARPQIRTAFIENLYTEIDRKPAFFHNLFALLNGRRNFASALVLLLLFAACARLLTSTEYHHEAVIGELDIFEMNYRLVAQPYRSSMPTRDDSQDNSFEPQAVQPMNFIGLEELLERLPYIVQLPTWVPEGYVRQERFQDDLSLWSYMFFIGWHSEVESIDFALIVRAPLEMSNHKIEVASGKWEQVSINGTEAVLVKGSFESPFENEEDYFSFYGAEETYKRSYWNNDLGLRLIWIDDGVYYELASPPFTGSSLSLPFDNGLEMNSISEDEMFKIAESIIFGE